MADEKQDRSRVSREEWAKRVERWRDSGLRSSEFATELGINPRTLTYWKWMLGKEARGEQRSWPKRKGAPVAAAGAQATEAKGLIEIQVAPRDTRIELELKGGRRVRIPQGFDAQGLSRLLDLLEAR